MRWDYAILVVMLESVETEPATYRATARSGDEQLFDRTLTDNIFSAPLRRMGDDGWELVSTSNDSAVFSADHIEGIEALQLAQPVVSRFFFKRPRPGSGT